MRIQLLLLIALLVASPCAAQSRVYTNADLGQHLSPAMDITPAAAAALLAPHQFVYVAPAPGPQIVIVGGQPADGPFGAFAPFPPSIPLEWSMSAYVGHGYGHEHAYGPIVRTGPLPPLVSTVARPAILDESRAIVRRGPPNSGRRD